MSWKTLSFGLALVGFGVQAHAQAPRSAANLPAPTLPRKHTGKPTKAPITKDDLMTRLYKFADDSMGGRESGRIGNVMGTDYIASEVKRLGLKPGAEDGSYFQTYPVLVSVMDSTKSFFKIGETPLKPWVDFFPASSSPVEVNQIEVIYGGRVGDPNRLSDSLASGRVVVFGPVTEEILKADPTAVAKYPPVARAASLNLYAGFSRFSAARIKELQAAVGQGPRVTYVSDNAVEALFGKKLNDLKSGDLGQKVSIRVELASGPSPFPSRNVIAILEGSDPKLKHTYVSIGSHNDHVGFSRPVDHDSIRILNYMTRPGGAENNPRPLSAELWTELNSLLADHRKVHGAKIDTVFNGADDNGSGSMSILEIAEYLSSLKPKDRPKRSIIFIWYTAEEKGLLGSDYYTKNLKNIAMDSIIANINIDMIGRGFAHDTKNGGDNFLMLVGSRRLSTEFGELVEEVNKTKAHGFEFDYSLDSNGHPQQIYCRSDHANWARYGVPVVFFMTGTHSDYHMLSDEPQYINYPHMEKIAKYVNDLLVATANLAERPKLNGPKPNPGAGCRQ